VPVRFWCRLQASPPILCAALVAFDRGPDGWPVNVEEVRLTGLPAAEVRGLEVFDLDGQPLWILPVPAPVPIADGDTVLIPPGAIVARSTAG
jgi:hypothetical protein